MTNNRRTVIVGGVTLEVPQVVLPYNYDIFTNEIVRALKKLRLSLNRRVYRNVCTQLFEAFLLDDKLTYQTKSYIALRFRTHSVCNRWNLANLKDHDLREYMRRSSLSGIVLESLCQNRNLSAATVNLIFSHLGFKGSKKFVLMLTDEALNPIVITEIFLLAEKRKIKEEVRERMVKFYKLDPATPFSWLEKIAEGETRK